MSEPTKKLQYSELSRRGFLAGSAALAAGGLAGCTVSVPQNTSFQPRFPRWPGSTVEGTNITKSEYRRIYGAVTDGGFQIPEVDLEKVPEQFWRRRVAWSGTERPGTILVNTSTFFLHHVEEGGTAMRYGVGLGRQGFEWSGKANIAWKRAWPTWTPPAEMIARQPELEKYSAENGGQEPGITNPLGARALYIHQNGVDTLYRIHGTPQYWTIGKAVSSGCVRMMNQDVIHLYENVRNGSPIIVR